MSLREREHLHLSNFNNSFSACHLRKLQFFYLTAYIQEKAYLNMSINHENMSEPVQNTDYTIFDINYSSIKLRKE
jgi:hypothetical protein